MFEILRSIAGSLNENANPQTVARCAEFFIEHGQFEKAVQLFITGKRYTAAIDLCVQHKVKITDEMAEGLTPPKESEGEKGAEDRNEVLRSLARACKKQGSFQLACKKYTQVEMKVFSFFYFQSEWSLFFCLKQHSMYISSDTTHNISFIF
jgi:intraflagellar transport protein 140